MRVQINIPTDGWTYIQADGQIDKWNDRHVGEKTDGATDRQKDGLMERQKDRQSEFDCKSWKSYP